MGYKDRTPTDAARKQTTPFQEQSSRAVGVQKHLGFPVVIAAALIAVTVTLSYALCKSEQRHLSELVEDDASLLVTRIKADFTARVSALHRIAGRWSVRGGMDKKAFLSDAHLIYADFPGFQALQWIDPELTVRWIEPLAGNEVALGIKSGFEPRRLAALQKSQQQNRPMMTNAINLLQGGKGFLLYVPLYKNNEFDGFLLAVFRLDEWLSHALDLEADNALGHNFVLSLDGEEVYSKSESPPCEYTIERSLQMYGHELTLKFWPSDEYVRDHTTSLPWVVGFTGVVLAVAIAFMICLWRMATIAARTAESRQERLTEEVAERKAAQQALHKLAYYDSLTGLASRRLAMDRLHMSVNIARERGCGMALLYVDVDGFKSINDSWGHDVGDRLLTKVADVMENSVRDVDTVARLGGDEFLVVINDLENQQHSVEVANRIMESLVGIQALDSDERTVRVNASVSIGIALYPENGATVDELLALADRAMYESKKAGKNRCTLASMIDD